MTDYEIYLDIKQRYINGWSEEKIAKDIGRSRSYVQRRVWLAKMPEIVLEKWLADGITDKELAALAKANLAGNLGDVWRDFLSGMDITTKENEEPRTKDGVLRTVSQIRLMAERTSLTKSARNALLWVLRERDTI